MKYELVKQGIELEVEKFSPLYVSMDFLTENEIISNTNEVDYSQLQVSNMGTHIKLINDSKIVADWTSIQIFSENIDFIINVFEALKTKFKQIKIKEITFSYTIHLSDIDILKTFNNKLIKIEDFELKHIVMSLDNFMIGFHECQKDRLHLNATKYEKFDNLSISEITADLKSVQNSIFELISNFLEKKLKINGISIQ